MATERRKLLDMADDGFGDSASVQKGFIEERNRQGFHIAANAHHQGEATPEKFVHQFLADIPFIAEQFSGEVLGKFLRGRCIANVTGRQFEGDDLALMIKHEVPFETKKSTSAYFAARGKTCECFAPVDPAVMTDDQRRAVDVINAHFVPHAAGPKKGQQRLYVFVKRINRW